MVIRSTTAKSSYIFDDMNSRILVYGSCVSRDVLRVSEHGFELGGYIARQSLVSAFSPPLRGEFELGLPSAFQERSLNGDLQSNLARQIKARAIAADLLLIDLHADGMGVLPVENSPSILTDSPEFRRSQLRSTLNFDTKIEFGSPAHLELFQSAAAEFKALLEEVNIFDKTALIKVPWTDESTSNDKVPQVMGQSAQEWHTKYENYYEITRRLGFRELSNPDVVLATPYHQWGLSQDHFTDNVYAHWATQILDISLSRQF